VIRPKLRKTYSFRLALWYVGLFAVSATAVFAFIWWAGVTFMLKQTDEIIESEVWSLMEQYEERGLAALAMQISGRQRTGSSRSNIYLLVDRDLHYLAGNIRTWPASLLPKGYPEMQTISGTHLDDSSAFEARVLVVTLLGKVHLLVGRELSDVMRARQIMAQAMGAGIVFTVVMGLVWGNVMSRMLLKRLDQVNRASREIIGGALERRIPVSGAGDEFDRLAGNLNDMLDRIEELIATVRQVSDNIAHDLRSPLTRLRSRLELALLEKPDPLAQRQAMEEAIGQAESIIATFNALLTIAKAESNAARSAFEPIDLGALAGEAAELYEPLAEDKGVRLSVDAGAGVIVRGNRHLLSQAVANLLDNAVKYTPAGGEVAVRVAALGGFAPGPGEEREGLALSGGLRANGHVAPAAVMAAGLGGAAMETARGNGRMAAGNGTRAGVFAADAEADSLTGQRSLAALLEVRDSGPGIPEEERANVLRRFYRLDASRNTPGSGLGLSLVAAVAKLHGARLELAGNDPGLTVSLVFLG
jgi:signal transduction histidine kinase